MKDYDKLFELLDEQLKKTTRIMKYQIYFHTLSFYSLKYFIIPMASLWINPHTHTQTHTHVTVHLKRSSIHSVNYLEIQSKFFSHLGLLYRQLRREIQLLVATNKIFKIFRKLVDHLGSSNTTI